ncbi:hypothetical protein AB0H77_06050 [Streptomyces sp. NPDC050844]|uniref:deazapurine DNA modification protein DpdA family protein n=1 Tax=Streptomyces sp. NPDC050844 TaxID=3155790 RepID=UPI0033CFA3DB
MRIHQRLTVDNLVELRRLAPEIKFIPVLQGSSLEDYVHCDQLYAQAGIDLAAEPVVGLGSVCRRQATSEIREIVEHFAGKGYLATRTRTAPTTPHGRCTGTAASSSNTSTQPHDPRHRSPPAGNRRRSARPSSTTRSRRSTVTNRPSKPFSVAEWICCQPLDPKHALCAPGLHSPGHG